MNLSTNINLLKLTAKVMNIAGEACVVMPIKQNDLHVTTDERGNAKGVFLDLIHFENKQPNKYGDTHMVKQSHSKEYRLEHDGENQPIIGNTKPSGAQGLNTESLPSETNAMSWDDIAKKSRELQGL